MTDNVERQVSFSGTFIVPSKVLLFFGAIDGYLATTQFNTFKFKTIISRRRRRRLLPARVATDRLGDDLPAHDSSGRIRELGEKIIEHKFKIFR